MVFSILRDKCNYHHTILKNLNNLKNKTSYLSSPDPSSPPSSKQSVFYIYKFPYSRDSYEWNAMIGGLLWVSGFPVGAVLKNLPANTKITRDVG